VPPGVPEPAVWGDRPASAEPAAPAEVAASAVGGRVRRRRP
jgi:NADH-quinone oxidoreductase subunit C